MFAESLLFAMILVLIGQGLHLAFERAGSLLALPPNTSLPSGPTVRALGYVGAGIYEEVLFRLVMLPLCVTALLICLPRREACIAAVCLTSVVFAAAHYIEPGGDGWVAAVPGALEHVANGASLRFSFVFRAVAGLVFGALFLRRGFGVTVGAHALYDLLVGVVMQPGA
jgi:membrane protease YdiL (CAAX protease family)